ncbi:hypothetical protein WAI453_000481 [Rhynchosporium graminicola]
MWWIWGEYETDDYTLVVSPLAKLAVPFCMRLFGGMPVPSLPRVPLQVQVSLRSTTSSTESYDFDTRRAQSFKGMVTVVPAFITRHEAIIWAPL